MKVTAFPLGDYQANCYLIAEEEGKVCALIDPGDQPGLVKKMVEETGCELKFIALTHGHFDHMGAVADLVEAYPEVVVYRHEGDDPKNAGGTIFPTIEERVLRDIVDGDEIALGSLTFQVLHTPGHSEGSVVFQLEDALFTGDTLFAGSMGRTDFQGGSMEKIMASMKRLSTLPEHYQVCAGHMGMSTIGEEKRSNPYMRQAMQS